MRLVGITHPATVLANIYIDILEIPRHLLEDDDFMGNTERLKAKTLFIDPFPILSRHDARKALSGTNGKPGAFIVHGLEGHPSADPGFKQLTVSYIPTGDDCELTDLFIFRRWDDACGPEGQFCSLLGWSCG